MQDVLILNIIPRDLLPNRALLAFPHIYTLFPTRFSFLRWRRKQKLFRHVDN